MFYFTKLGQSEQTKENQVRFIFTKFLQLCVVMNYTIKASIIEGRGLTTTTSGVVYNKNSRLNKHACNSNLAGGGVWSTTLIPVRM